MFSSTNAGRQEPNWAHRIKSARENTTLKLVVAVLAIVLGGFMLLVLSARRDLWIGYEVCQTVVRDLGSLLLVTLFVSLLWEFLGKRGLLDEVLMNFGVAKELQNAGIKEAHRDFHSIDWKPFFEDVREIDLFFAWAYSWRYNNTAALVKAASTKKVRIRIFLPDPNRQDIVSEMSRRFNRDADHVIGQIKDAIDYFGKLSNRQAQVEVHLVPTAPVFTLYRFDASAIVVFYSHSDEEPKPSVPAIICEKGGWLYSFVVGQFAALSSMDSAIADKGPKS
ncbi:MAG: hypothetical protein V2B18_16775 [Pseudomonadota bacterium]